MKVLVLGGTLFIGLHLVRSLCAEGHQVTLLNRGKTHAPLPPGCDITRLYCDRNDAQGIAAALEGARYDAAVDVSGYSPAMVSPVVDALEGAVGHYVFVSSGAVYGPEDAPVEIAPIPEDYPLYHGPDAGAYVEGKVRCEELLMDAFVRRGFPATILRPVYVYGPDNPRRDAETSYFARLRLGRKIVIPGDGLTLFHPVHVDDVASAFLAVLGRRQRALGEAYNVAGPEAVTGDGYIKAIAEAMGVAKPQVVHVGLREYEAFARGGGGTAGSSSLVPSPSPPIYPYQVKVSRVCSIRKAERDLSWTPSNHIGEGLRMTYRWWVDSGRDKEEDDGSWDFSREDRLVSGGTG